MQEAKSFNNFAKASVKGNDHKIHNWHISKDEAINKLKNSVLGKNEDHCKKMYRKLTFFIFKRWIKKYLLSRKKRKIVITSKIILWN